MLYKDMIIEIIKRESKVLIDENIKEIFENECYKTLERIRAVLNDENLNDKECFDRIEKIVKIYESVGSDGGIRHDF